VHHSPGELRVEVLIVSSAEEERAQRFRLDADTLDQRLRLADKLAAAVVAGDEEAVVAAMREFEEFAGGGAPLTVDVERVDVDDRVSADWMGMALALGAVDLARALHEQINVLVVPCEQDVPSVFRQVHLADGAPAIGLNDKLLLMLPSVTCACNVVNVLPSAVVVQVQAEHAACAGEGHVAVVDHAFFAQQGLFFFC